MARKNETMRRNKKETILNILKIKYFILIFILLKQNTRARCPLKYSINTNKTKKK